MPVMHDQIKGKRHEETAASMDMLLHAKRKLSHSNAFRVINI